MYEDYRSRTCTAIARQWYPSGDTPVGGAVYTLTKDGCIDVSGGEGQYLVDYLNEEGRQILRPGDWIVRVGGRFFVCSDVVFHVLFQKVQIMSGMVI